MKNFFIYQYEDVVSSSDKLKITVLFIHQAVIPSQNALAQELNHFFQEHSITDKLVVLVPEYLDAASLEFFISSKEVTFQRIPGKSSDYFERALLIYQFDANGSFRLLDGNNPKMNQNLLPSC